MLGFIYAKSRNVIYPIAMHMLINLIGTVPVVLLSDSLDRVFEAMEGLATDNAFDITPYYNDLLAVGAYSFITNALVIAGVILVISYIRRRKLSVPEVCDFRLPREHAFSTVVSNVGSIIFLSFSALTIILNLLPHA